MIPNARERKALEGLRHLPWEDDASLFVGAGTIASLLEKRWAERVESRSGAKRLKITELGLAALDAPIPAKPTRKPLKMVEPRIPTLSPRIRTLKQP